jgi:hypothetical protein
MLGQQPRSRRGVVAGQHPAGPAVLSHGGRPRRAGSWLAARFAHRHAAAEPL